MRLRHETAEGGEDEDQDQNECQDQDDLDDLDVVVPATEGVGGLLCLGRDGIERMDDSDLVEEETIEEEEGGTTEAAEEAAFFSGSSLNSKLVVGSDRADSLLDHLDRMESK